MKEPPWSRRKSAAEQPTTHLEAVEKSHLALVVPLRSRRGCQAKPPRNHHGAATQPLSNRSGAAVDSPWIRYETARESPLSRLGVDTEPPWSPLGVRCLRCRIPLTPRKASYHLIHDYLHLLSLSYFYSLIFIINFNPIQPPKRC